MSTERTDLPSPLLRRRRSFRVSRSTYLFSHRSYIDDYDHESDSVFLHVIKVSELVLVLDSFFLLLGKVLEKLKLEVCGHHVKKKRQKALVGSC